MSCWDPGRHTTFLRVLMYVVKHMWTYMRSIFLKNSLESRVSQTMAWSTIPGSSPALLILRQMERYNKESLIGSTHQGWRGLLSGVEICWFPLHNPTFLVYNWVAMFWWRTQISLTVLGTAQLLMRWSLWALEKGSWGQVQESTFTGKHYIRFAKGVP